jgi:DNA-directed RNA polymerase subunit RPC12/RpoP
MDLTFACSNCRQEMVVDATGAGTEVECPGCGTTVLVPQADILNLHVLNPISSSAAAKEEHHYSVPVRETPPEVLIQKPQPPLEAAVKETEKKLRIRCIRRVDCMEVGHDHFDEKVSDFLGRIGPDCIVSVNTLSYTFMDMASRQLLTDYGVMVIYKG